MTRIKLHDEILASAFADVLAAASNLGYELKTNK